MPRRARQECDSSIYHVMNRGTGKQVIFEDDGDRTFFMSRLSEILADTEGELLAWCLMENHFHVVLQMSMDDLSHTMHKLQTGYAGYFNRVHGRTGTLFGTRFRSESIDSEEYLLTAVRYVHANPVKAGLCIAMEDYAWSSYREYLSNAMYANTSFVLDLTDGREGFIAFHAQEANDHLIDIQDGSPRMSDFEALAIAKKCFGDSGLGSIKSMDAERRNDALRLLRRKGLGVRQIQRITGVSAAAVSRAGQGR